MENNEAKQKAKELIESFIAINGNSFFAKQCAIKVCNEVIDNNNAVPMAMFTMYLIDNTLFYKQVKKEIENYEQ